MSNGTRALERIGRLWPILDWTEDQCVLFKEQVDRLAGLEPAQIDAAISAHRCESRYRSPVFADILKAIKNARGDARGERPPTAPTQYCDILRARRRARGETNIPTDPVDLLYEEHCRNWESARRREAENKLSRGYVDQFALPWTHQLRADLRAHAGLEFEQAGAVALDAWNTWAASVSGVRQLSATEWANPFADRKSPTASSIQVSVSKMSGAASVQS